MDGGTRETVDMDFHCRPVPAGIDERGAFLETLKAVAPLQRVCLSSATGGAKKKSTPGGVYGAARGREESLLADEFDVVAPADSVQAVGEIQHLSGRKGEERA